MTNAGTVNESRRAPKPKSSSAGSIAQCDDAGPHSSLGYLMPAEFVVKFKPGGAGHRAI